MPKVQRHPRFPIDRHQQSCLIACHSVVRIDRRQRKTNVVRQPGTVYQHARAVVFAMQTKIFGKEFTMCRLIAESARRLGGKIRLNAETAVSRSGKVSERKNLPTNLLRNGLKRRPTV
jgi:hypothetical protein